MSEKKNSLLRLFVPIYFETLFLMATGIVDTLMLSPVPNGVGAVGTANTYVSMFFILLMVVSRGMLAVVTQYIGAGKPGVAYQARQIALICNAVLGLVIAGTLALLAEPVLRWLNTAPALIPGATMYMRIVAVGYLFDAITLIYGSYLRAFGHNREPFTVAAIGNIINIGLNALFLYAFGWGVTGVAIATVIGKLCTLVIVAIVCLRRAPGKELPERESRKLILCRILRIGLPAAVESISYSVAMAIVVGFVNKMDPDGVNATALAYTQQISSFSYCAAFALSQANCFFVGWRIGANQMKECYKGTIKACLIAIGLGVGCQIILASLGRPLASTFTADEALIKAVQFALLIDIGLEIGRATNLVVGQALKISGYSLVPSVYSLIANALVAIGGTYLFGIVLGWGVLGCMFALALDEGCRGILLFSMWALKKWEKASIIRRGEAPVAATGEAHE